RHPRGMTPRGQPGGFLKPEVSRQPQEANEPGRLRLPGLEVPVSLIENHPASAQPDTHLATPTTSEEVVPRLIRAMSEPVLAEARQLSSDDIQAHCRCLAEAFAL